MQAETMPMSFSPVNPCDSAQPTVSVQNTYMERMREMRWLVCPVRKQTEFSRSILTSAQDKGMRGTGFMWTLLKVALMPEFKPGNPNSPPPPKLLSVIFKCAYRQHRVYSSSIVNAVISPHLLLSFLLSSSSFLSLLLHLSQVASRIPEDVWKCGGNVRIQGDQQLAL